jgi:rhomboid protease GluP
MLNDPQPPKRNPHPLEQQPQPQTSEDQPARPQIRLRMPIVQPTATYVLIAINIIVFVIGMLSPRMEAQLFNEGASRPLQVLIQGEYYRLFTAMFLHANLLHIFFNGYALYIVGRSLEPLFGHARFTIIYLLGGLGGSVLSVILGDLSANVGSVGASGAVFAIFGAEMVYLYRHREILGARGKAQFRNMLVLIAMNFFIGLASTAPGTNVRIDNWAHLGGLIGGLILTWFIGPRLVLRWNPLTPETTTAEDTNPLNQKYWAVSLYGIGLIAILAVATLVARGGSL